MNESQNILNLDSNCYLCSLSASLFYIILSYISHGVIAVISSNF